MWHYFSIKYYCDLIFRFHFKSLTDPTDIGHNFGKIMIIFQTERGCNFFLNSQWVFRIFELNGYECLPLMFSKMDWKKIILSFKALRTRITYKFQFGSQLTWKNEKPLLWPSHCLISKAVENWGIRMGFVA